MIGHGPDDGWAYSPIELTAIWAIPVDVDEIAQSRIRVFEFHERMAAKGFAADQEASDLLLRDSVAQVYDPGPRRCNACAQEWIGTRTSSWLRMTFALCCGIECEPDPEPANNDADQDGA